MIRPWVDLSAQRLLQGLADVAESTAAKIGETLHRAPAGAIQEQMAADVAYAEGVRDALGWTSGVGAPTGRLQRLLEL